MALTDNCDVFVSFHEDGFNRILQHLQEQRPSMFNFATRQVAQNPQMLCSVIGAAPIVGLRGNPLVTIVDLLPVPGTDYGLNFAVQLVKARIDFHPGNQFALPPELTPLGVQRFAIAVKLCAGLGCPSRKLVNDMVSAPQDLPSPSHREPKDSLGPSGGLKPIPATRLTCFCLEAFLTGGFRIASYAGKPYLEPVLDGFEIVDIRPEGLESSLECYVQVMLRLVVLPQMRILLQHAPVDIIKNVLALNISPMPTSPALPNNPAIEKDQLEAFIKVEVV